MAVFVIFIFQGLMLRTNEVIGGLVRWRFHLFLQCYIFVLCPALFILIAWMAGDLLSREGQIGIWFMAALPTTIATSLVYATRAGGRQIETITNIVIANSLAVIVTPAWMYLLLNKQTDSLNIIAVIGKLAVLILLPLLIGVVLRKWCAHRADQSTGAINNINSLLILFIAYCAFAESAHAGTWSQDQAGNMLGIVAVTLVCLLLNMLMAHVLACVAGLNASDRISFFFCGTFATLNNKPILAITEKGLFAFLANRIPVWGDFDQTKSVSAVSGLGDFEGAVIIAHDGQYLGEVTWDNLDADSITNHLGTYGSKISSLSIFNKIGSYGNNISTLSPLE